MMEALELANIYIKQLSRQVVERNAALRECARRIGSLEKQVADEQRKRREAEANASALQREAAENLETITELAERVGELEGDKQSLEADRDAALGGSSGRDEPAASFDELDAEEQDAIRYRLRCEQALRARLAKTDMSPRARLRTLREAKRSGMLNRRLRAELQELREALE